MNNQDYLYNISLTAPETEDVMNALADKANTCGRLQKKIYNQAVQQKSQFDSFFREQQQEVQANTEASVEEQAIEEKTTKKKNKKEAEAV